MVSPCSSHSTKNVSMHWADAWRTSWNIRVHVPSSMLVIRDWSEIRLFFLHKNQWSRPRNKMQVDKISNPTERHIFIWSFWFIVDRGMIHSFNMTLLLSYPSMDSSHAAGQTRAARYIMLAPGSAMIDAALRFLNNCVWMRHCDRVQKIYVFNCKLEDKIIVT